MLVCGLRAVTSDVMEAYKAAVLEDLRKAEAYAVKHSIENMGPEYFVARRVELSALKTGYWDNGWRSTTPL